MLNVKSMSKWVVNTGCNTWLLATVIILAEKGKGKIMKDNTVIDRIKDNWIEAVFFQWSIKENTDLKVMSIGLQSIRHKVIIQTDASDDIEAFRTIRGLAFSLKVTPPTKEKNTVNVRNLSLLKETDELLFTINSEEDYINTIYFLKNKLTVKPIVSFVLEMPEKEKQLIVDKLLVDSQKFLCRIRVFNS